MFEGLYNNIKNHMMPSMLMKYSRAVSDSKATKNYSIEVICLQLVINTHNPEAKP